MLVTPSFRPDPRGPQARKSDRRGGLSNDLRRRHLRVLQFVAAMRGRNTAHVSLAYRHREPFSGTTENLPPQFQPMKISADRSGADIRIDILDGCYDVHRGSAAPAALYGVEHHVDVRL